MSNDYEETDPREGLLHPRHRATVVGHEAAQERLISALSSGKFHHGWLLCGPQGIGKATLAYTLAKCLLRGVDPSSLATSGLAGDAEDATAAQVSARAHPDLLVIERAEEKGKLKANINVDVARKAAEFFSKTAGAGGWRVAIVDAADDMNIASANALLKTLEEPPERSAFILVCHQLGRLLPTVRSRCISLDLHPLAADDVSTVLQSVSTPETKKAESYVPLAGGSPGMALALAETGAGELFQRFATSAQSGLLDQRTRTDIANALFGKGTDDRFNIFCALLNGWITSHAKTLAADPLSAPKALALARSHSEISRSIRETNALNLDRRLTMLQAFEKIDAARLGKPA